MDPFGHQWNISSHLEDVAPEEMQRRMKELADETGAKQQAHPAPDAG